MGEYDRIIVDELQKMREAIKMTLIPVQFTSDRPNYTLLLVVIVLELVVIIVKL